MSEHSPERPLLWAATVHTRPKGSEIHAKIIKRHSVWRRKKDGVHVSVVKYDIDLDDVLWVSCFKPRRKGECYADAFLNTYELVSTE